MTEPDAVMIRMARAARIGQAGDREAARELFSEIWRDIGGEAGDPLHRCALAHSMADVQDDPHQELMWDLRALDAADLITDQRAALAGVTSPVTGFYPSLHLNLAECHRKLGDLDLARKHLQRANAVVGTLADDEYGRMIRAGLQDLARRLSPAADFGESS